MVILNILLDKWELLSALISAFIVGFLGGEAFFRLSKVRALNWAERLDSLGGRKPLFKIIYKILRQPHGALKTILFIFGVNLTLGALLYHTVGGILIAPPFFNLIAGGLLVSLTMKRYPERVPLYVIVVPFEISAYIIAAVGGVGIGLNLFGGGNVAFAVWEWITLFTTMVMPIQFIAAFFEGILLHRLFVVQGRPWPQWLFDEQDQHETSKVESRH